MEKQADKMVREIDGHKFYIKAHDSKEADIVLNKEGGIIQHIIDVKLVIKRTPVSFNGKYGVLECWNEVRKRRTKKRCR